MKKLVVAAAIYFSPVADPYADTRRMRVSVPSLRQIVEAILALLILALCAPFLALLAGYVAWHFRANPFFIQERVGRGGKVFRIIKLRSMKRGDPVLNASRAETLQRNRERITSFGKFLRGYHIDEIPNLINIIKFEMAFVGPRALVPEQTAREYYAPRNENIIPGVMGWQQLLSLKNSSNVDSLIEADKYYAQEKSLELDVYIVVHTVYHLITKAFSRKEEAFLFG